MYSESRMYQLHDIKRGKIYIDGDMSYEEQSSESGFVLKAKYHTQLTSMT